MVLLVFVIGTILGSFSLVLVNRSIRQESIVYPPSHCEYCNHSLKAIDLFPIFSYIFLKGRCRYCGEKLSLEYPLIEIFSGLIAILAFLNRPILEASILLIAYILSLIIALIDYKTFEIYNSHLYTLLILSLFYRIFYLGINLEFLIFILSFSLIYLLIYKLSNQGLGDGDYYYYLAFLFILKDSLLLKFIFLSIWIGALFGILLAIKEKTTKIKMPFCIYIFTAFIILSSLDVMGFLI